MLRLPQRAGAIKRTILLTVAAAIVVTVVGTGILIVRPTLMLRQSMETRNRQTEVWRADIAEKLSLPLDRIQSTDIYKAFHITDEGGRSELEIFVGNQNDIAGVIHSFPYPSDFTTAAYSPSAMADIVKRELAWFLAEEPENISCIVQDKELNAAKENPEMLYIHCQNTATGRRYIADIIYQDGLGLKSIVRVEESNDLTTH